MDIEVRPNLLNSLIAEIVGFRYEISYLSNCCESPINIIVVINKRGNMSESIKKIRPVAAVAIAALLVAVPIVVGVPLQTVYAAGDKENGGEGCTPGFWKNHPFPDGYSRDDLFVDVFGVVIADDPDLTLGEALDLGGGGENALARQAVAALLNAASDDVDFEFTEAEVIEKVQDAIASGDPEEIEDLKDEFDTENNRGCPL
jgi:hypothetical protein